MIKKYTPAQVFQLYSQSPPDIQETAISVRAAEQLGNIVLKHKLSDDQTIKTAQLLGLVVFGLLHPDDLAANFQKELGIEPTRAKALYRDIWEILLRPIETSLRRIHGPIKSIEEIEIEAEFKPPTAPIKPPLARIEEIKKEAVAPPPIRVAPPAPSRVEAPPARPTPPPPPIRPVLPKKEEFATSRTEALVPSRAEAYLEPIEEEIKPPVPAPPRPMPPKAEKIEIGGIPVETLARPEAPERPVTPPRISALYLEPIEEEEPPQNIVDLRKK